MEKQTFPILEFDAARSAKIEPGRLVTKLDVPACCVITFFGNVIAELAQAGRLTQISTFITATTRLPVYEMEHRGQRIGLIQGFLGAAGAAAELEELIATGFSRFIVCGAAGVLQRGIQVGRLVLPTSAVRDEGTSYHYLAPSREAACNAHAVEVAERCLTERGIPYLKAKTWTTDAFYRETEDKIALRVAEGCVTVEMEAAAFFAVSAFRGVTLGQILYGGDDLSGVEWDDRRWQSREEIQRNLVELSLDVCLEL